MKCDRAIHYVDAYADGEVSGWRRIVFQRHLRACPGCAARLDEAFALQARIRAESPRYTAPPTLRARMQALRDQQTKASSTRDAAERRWPWIGAGALAGSVATIALWLGAGVVRDQRMSDDLALTTVNAHVQATLGNRLIEVASSDQHTVKPWLSARLDYSPPVRDFASDGFTLTGGRIETVNGDPVATLVYRYRLHTVDVFVRPDWTRAASIDTRAIRGFNVIHMKAHGMDWVVVSDASPESLATLVRDLSAATP